MTNNLNFISSGTPEWHAARKGRITATSAAAILGVDPHRTALQVWAELTDKVQDDFQGNAFSTWGLATEDANRQLLASEAGLQVTDSPGFVIDTELPWLGATPDGLVGRTEDPSAPLGVWEGKSPSVWTVADWQDDEAPLAYLVQIQVQQRVTGLDWGVLSALCPPKTADDSPLWWREVERNQRFQESMIETLIEFWEQNVQKDIPPAATGHKIDRRVLQELHPKDDGRVVVLPSEVGAVCYQLDKAKAEIRRQQQIEADLGNHLRQMIGNATYAVVPDGPVYSWKHQVSHFAAQEAHTRETRVLRKLQGLPKGVEMPREVSA